MGPFWKKSFGSVETVIYFHIPLWTHILSPAVDTNLEVVVFFFNVKCTAPYFFEGFIYDEICKLLLFSVFPVQCYIISFLYRVH